MEPQPKAYPLAEAGRASAAMQRIITAIANKQGIDLLQQGGPTGLQDPFLGTLAIANVGPHLVRVAQDESRLVADLTVVFFTCNDQWIPLGIAYQRFGLRRQCATVEADGHLTILDNAAQAEVAIVCDLWAAAIERQGWLKLPPLYD